MPHDERVTRWSFYNYILAIDPEMFAGATNEVVCAAMEAEGIPAEVQYPSMNRYELFQPSIGVFSQEGCGNSQMSSCFVEIADLCLMSRNRFVKKRGQMRIARAYNQRAHLL